jgi:glutamine amidotransferase
VIAIVDYDMGNIASVANMLKRVGAEDVVITRSAAELENADKVILPGVGAFDKGMRNLKSLGLDDILSELAIERKVPVLGICLGMQLMTRTSEEGSSDGLGWIDAETVRFRFPEGSGLKVPHIGWEYVLAAHDNPLIPSSDPARFYFVHGYYVKCRHEDDVIATAHYGHEFVSAFRRDNLFGVQFHPEKSHSFGMHLIRNFAQLAPWPSSA